MENVSITFENQTIEFPKGTTYLEISKLSKNKDSVLAVKRNNEILSLDSQTYKDENIEFINYNSLEGANIYKSGLKFILEVATKKALKDSDIFFLHSVPGGMLTEIKYERELTIEDISSIKKEMSEIISGNYPITKHNILKKEVMKFYSLSTLTEKFENTRVSDDILTSYKLKNNLNYFYTLMPSSTGVIRKFDLKYIGKNRLIVLYPNAYSNGKVPDYVAHENIVKEFYKGEHWLQRLGVPYVSNLNELISKGKIRGFIESCELNFFDEIKKTVDDAIRNSEKRFIMIAGPSSSGKTTTTRVMSAYLRSLGYDPVNISLDDYFVERVDNPKDEFGKYDFECLNAIDINLLNNQLGSLLKGETIDVPTYNFVTGKKEYNDKKITLKDNSIILMEGLHCLNDDLTPYIPTRYKYKIYLSPFIPLNIDRHNYISTVDSRLLRRIVRDNRTRGYTVDQTINGWQTVRRGEEKYIFPYVHQADSIINTALPYELGVLKVFADPLLLSVNTDSPYYEEARRLLFFLKTFYPISSELVSKTSILREFIGGNSND